MMVFVNYSFLEVSFLGNNFLTLVWSMVVVVLATLLIRFFFEMDFVDQFSGIFSFFLYILLGVWILDASTNMLFKRHDVIISLGIDIFSLSKKK
jgi:hypothetical protein